MSFIRGNDFFVNLLKERSDNWELVGDYKNARTDVTCRCKRCGILVTKKARCFMEFQQRCPVCDGESRAYIGVNDVKSQNPQLAALFVDQSRADKVTIYSNKEDYIKCPECGTVDKYRICDVTRRGFSCRACSSGRSYPNKLMFNLLKLKLDTFKPEFRPNWAQRKQYDFMFSLGDKNYIVEMDGSFHYSDNQMNGISCSEQNKIDKEKTILATQHGLFVIRIDCNYSSNSRFDYIKTNILSSKLQELLLFSDADFSLANNIASKSDLAYICDLYDNSTHEISAIMQKTGLSYGTVIRRLIEGANIGMCSYNHDEQKIIRNEKRKEKTARSNGIMILCLETNEIFYSINSVKRRYGGSLDRYFRGEADHAGTLPNGTKLHYRKITECESEFLIKNLKAIPMDIDLYRDNEYKEFRKFSKAVRCDQTGEYFANYKAAKQKYNANLASYFCHRHAYSGRLQDGTKLSWTKLSCNEVMSYVESGGVFIYANT